MLAQNSNFYCNNSIPLQDVQDSRVTMNAALTGTANPRTLVKPTIVAPIAAFEYWKENPLTTLSRINRQTPQYPNLAGFKTSVCESRPACAPLPLKRAALSDPNFVPLQPNVYTATDTFEPVNASNGIAFTPRFPNTTLVFEDAYDRIYYDTDMKTNFIEARGEPIALDARGQEALEAGAPPRSECADGPFCARAPTEDISTDSDPNIYSVFDPRFSGYGSDNRQYTDLQLGQSRYFYKDVDAVRMPNYITRNKLDSGVTPIGDAYGKLDSGNISLQQARTAAEQNWLDNSINFRNDLTKSLMRKKNEEMVQRRLAPKYTSNFNHALRKH